MKALDFSRSYIRWMHPSNNVRILVEAACTVTDAAGESDTYYLIAPCRGERTHANRNLIQHPGYEFCGVWGEKESMIIRTHWESSRDNREVRGNTDTLDIRWLENTRSLADNRAVWEGTQHTGEPMVGRTTIEDTKRNLMAVMEYPINTMNVNKNPYIFQVDTGPMIVPDFTKTGGRAIEMFEVAYVLYNRFDEVEFALRKPVTPHLGFGRSAFITAYSDIRVMPATNELLLAVSD